MESERWITTPEAAERLGVTRQRIGQLVARQLLRAVRVGRQLVLRRQDVEALAGSRTAGAFSRLVERERAAGRDASMNPERYGETFRAMRKRLSR